MRQTEPEAEIKPGPVPGPGSPPSDNSGTPPSDEPEPEAEPKGEPEVPASTEKAEPEVEHKVKHESEVYSDEELDATEEAAPEPATIAANHVFKPDLELDGCDCDVASSEQDNFGPDSYPKVAPHHCSPPVVPPSDWHPPMGGYDLRDEWGDVCDADKPTDQGTCGSSWAHAFASMFSYRMCVQSHGKFSEMISVQQLISCDMGGTCAGGYDGFTARHFENADGTPKAIPCASDFPYTDGAGVHAEGSGEQCFIRDPKDNYSRTYAVDFSSYVTANYWYADPVDKRDEGSIKSVWLENCDLERSSLHALVDSAALSSSHKSAATGASESVRPMDHANVEQQRWLMYQLETFGPVTAVVSGSTFPRGGDPQGVHRCAEGCGTVDHSVIIVGWGETDPEDEGGVSEPYWIIQNSWTDKWKDEGRVKIARGENACCIEDRWMAIDPDFDGFRFGNVKYDPEDPRLRPGGSHPLPPKCINGGVLNHNTGVCECPFPWSGGGDADHDGCYTCGITDCGEGGVLDADACACICLPGHGGAACESKLIAAVAEAFPSIDMGVDGEGECTMRASLNLAEGDIITEDILVVVRTGTLTGPGGWTAVTSIGELCKAANTQSALGFRVTDLGGQDDEPALREKRLSRLVDDFAADADAWGKDADKWAADAKMWGGNTNKWRRKAAEWSKFASDWSATASKWSAMSSKLVSSFQIRLSQEANATYVAADCSCLGENAALDGKGIEIPSTGELADSLANPSNWVEGGAKFGKTANKWTKSAARWKKDAKKWSTKSENWLAKGTKKGKQVGLWADESAQWADAAAKWCEDAAQWSSDAGDWSASNAQGITDALVEPEPEPKVTCECAPPPSTRVKPEKPPAPVSSPPPPSPPPSTPQAKPVHTPVEPVHTLVPKQHPMRDTMARPTGSMVCPDHTTGVVVLLDLHQRGVQPAPGEEVFVTFVKSLGVNELGVSRGYDMTYFGEHLAVSAGTCNTPAGDGKSTTKVSPTSMKVSRKAIRTAKKAQRMDAKAARKQALDAAKDEIAAKKAAKAEELAAYKATKQEELARKQTARAEKRAAKKAEAQARKTAEKAKMNKKYAAAVKQVAEEKAMHTEKGAKWEKHQAEAATVKEKMATTKAEQAEMVAAEDAKTAEKADAKEASAAERAAAKEAMATKRAQKKAERAQKKAERIAKREARKDVRKSRKRSALGGIVGLDHVAEDTVSIYPGLGMGEDTADLPVPMPMMFAAVAAATVALVAVAAVRWAKSEEVAGLEQQPLLA